MKALSQVWQCPAWMLFRSLWHLPFLVEKRHIAVPMFKPQEILSRECLAASIIERPDDFGQRLPFFHRVAADTEFVDRLRSGSACDSRGG